MQPDIVPIIDTGGKFAVGVVNSGRNLPPVSLTPAANLSPVLLTPVANLPPMSTTQYLLEFSKNLKYSNPNVIFRGSGEGDHEKNLKQKIS
jgi:hypothetical protein